MLTREQLQEAYAAFRLPVGSDWKTIKKRYKLLVKAWHPDKQGGQVKEEVEQELKEYNHFYNDIFKIHFESEHLDDSSCVCQPVQEEHQEPDSDSFEFQESQSNQPDEPVEKIDPEIEARSQKRRWQASKLCGVVFVLILGYGFIGAKIKSILPVLKTESSVPATVPSPSSPSWRAPYQSISTPITRSPASAITAPSQQQLDDTKRAITANETKMIMLQQDIDSLKSQIKMADKPSAGILYRNLGSKEQELESLRQKTHYLKMSLGQ